MKANVQKIPAGIIEGIEGFVHKGEKYLLINGQTTLFHDSTGSIQRLIATIFINDTVRRDLLRKEGIVKFKEAFDKWFFCVMGALDGMPDIVKGKLVPDAFNSICTDYKCEMRGKMCGNLSFKLKGYEVETIQAFKQGHTIESAADKLCVSIPGMKSRLNILKIKMSAKNTTHLISISNELGI